MAESKATILQFPLGPLQTNCYVLACNETKRAAVIDPAWDGRAIYDKTVAEGWSIQHILLTHSHFDHVGGLAELKELSGAPIAVHPGAVPMLENAVLAGRMWQISIPEPPAPDVLINDGDLIELGNLQLEVLFTPGHAPGHVCFYLASEGVLFDGDVLFQQGIGRTDLPGGDYATLMDSIHQRLMILPDETLVLSGHGPATTIAPGKRNESLPDLVKGQPYSELSGVGVDVSVGTGVGSAPSQKKVAVLTATAAIFVNELAVRSFTSHPHNAYSPEHLVHLGDAGTP